MKNLILSKIGQLNKEKALTNVLLESEAVEISGQAKAKKPWEISSIFAEKQLNSMLVITSNNDEARFLYDNVREILDDTTPYLFSGSGYLPFTTSFCNVEVQKERITVLSKLARGEKTLVIAPITACVKSIMPKDDFLDNHLEIAVGDNWELSDLAKRLVDMGYSRETVVDGRGAFSLRGSVIDIFVYNQENPIRIDFFDTEIESIRYFSLETQRTIKDAGSNVLIVPASEMIVTREMLKEALPKIRDEFEETLTKLKGQAKYNLQTKFSPLIENFETALAGEGNVDPGDFAHFCYEGKSYILDYLKAGDVLVFDETDEIIQELNTISHEQNEYYIDLLDSGNILPSYENNYLMWADVLDRIRYNKAGVVSLQTLPAVAGIAYALEINRNVRDINGFVNRIDLLLENISYWQKEKYQIFVAVSNDLRKEKTLELLRGSEIFNVSVDILPVKQGFESSDLKIALITERELIGREQKNKLRNRQQKKGDMEAFVQFNPGDYVVHLNHGIGRYMGIEQINAAGATRDYMFIQYAGTDKLFVPVEQMDLVQKYIGTDGVPPKLYKLGGASWEKAKAKVHKSVEDMTDDLLKLYASRQSQKGYAFSPDTVWQKEFEDSFPYVETEDQLKATEEIKADMEKARPMDRLLCGDVGYGKTEVAFRAAFKAVQDNKQVAVLVPTTLLAEQHYNTFVERLKDFPVSVGVISRFITAKEQNQLLEKVEKGLVDILIGTHRLLSKDIKFKDLGLLIIDEEQRFGVAHKEKIKQWRNNVDVLTLSATPIPRTLHMSLVGMRDMSVINTPPEERIPVQTFVVEYVPQLIKEAILRELSRGGQVYFIHNKVEDIHLFASQIGALVPEAKILVAHGQMNERALEDVMKQFIKGEGNVLICTTIAESGLDIPNANTLIVDDADCFGLAQLYQLRGRVGRSSKQAFAYFTYKQNKLISTVAKKRLKAIRDFTELGSGFKIAMRDMEIRGAGNILGKEQHGHIASVGFDMYCRLVQQAIEKGMEGIENEFNSKEETITLNLGIDAFIPEEYIGDGELKVELYKKIAAANISDIENIKQELLDRFGNLPEVVDNLLMVGVVKNLAKDIGVESISKRNGKYYVALAENHNLVGEDLVKIAEKYNKQVFYHNKKEFTIEYRPFTPGKNDIYDLIVFLQFILSLNEHN